MATPIPENHAAFTIAEILAATGGELVQRGPARVTAVSTDSRAISEGACFVALRGEIHDGHEHVAAAAARGASAVVVDRDATPPGASVIRVRDTLTALGDLGRAHARRWRSGILAGRLPPDNGAASWSSASELRSSLRGLAGTLVGVTGSAGKTTTRVALAALLERLFPGEVHGGAGNLNNRVGVPHVLLGLEARHRVAVVEMGMNQPGEIAELCRVAEPDAGVVTLIAAAHTEGVGGVDGVAAEKGALFRALRAGALAIGNGDDARVRAGLERSPSARRVLYGRAADADVRIAAREPVGMTLSRLTIARGDASLSFDTPLLGEAGALATAAAIAVVERALGVTLDSAVCAEAFAGALASLAAGRLAPRVFASGLAVIDDTYNANPASTVASIQAAAEIARATSRRLVLVLGEMRELGALAAEGHDAVGRAAAASGAALVFAVGPGEAARIAAGAAAGGATAAHASLVEDAVALAQIALTTNDLVLVKGSRSIGTERVVARLAAAFDRPQGGAR